MKHSGNIARFAESALFRFGTVAVLSMFLTTSQTNHASASEPYRVGVGDILHVSVARIPQLTRRVTIEGDGTISYPLIGTMPAAGKSMEEIRKKIRAGLAGKVFRQRTPQGLENSLVIEADEVTATIAEYRPIYVIGDVFKPGSHAFRPGMSVRQAVALSGGFSVTRLRSDARVGDPIGLSGELDDLWLQFARQQAKIWMLQAELKGTSTIEKTFGDLPTPPHVLISIKRLAESRLRARVANYNQERIFLKQAIEDADQQIQVAVARMKKETQRETADEAVLKRTQELAKRGSLINLRITEARRQAMASASRKLQAEARLLQIQRDRGDFKRRLARLEEERSVRLLGELETATMELTAIRGRLQVTGDKLGQRRLATAASAKQGAQKLALTIHRKTAKGRQALKASNDSELMPGDTIEIVMPNLFSKALQLQ